MYKTDLNFKCQIVQLIFLFDKARPYLNLMIANNIRVPNLTEFFICVLYRPYNKYFKC